MSEKKDRVPSLPQKKHRQHKTILRELHSRLFMLDSVQAFFASGSPVPCMPEMCASWRSEGMRMIEMMAADLVNLLV